MSLWPPYLGAGIKITNISKDFLMLDVAMNLKWYNRNFVGTHFGGSLFSMTDPFYMLMLIKSLGSEYIIWDKASKIEFIKPGKGTVKAHFEFTQDEIDEIRQHAESKKKYLFNKEVFIFDEQGDIIAKVEKTLYVKKI
ncbi:DUF4442 domain-containing protein [Silvanigrella aquatica]|uniref:Tetrameric acyl-CoA thioesterase n=1 Tax=Silvanigrella aquatica TaxID=1915309 RepID=A0A1L4D4R3_9BACT|nr:tetrameric acyl-CoA thioesterase [Silvanigrella aquatica]